MPLTPSTAPERRTPEPVRPPGRFTQGVIGGHVLRLCATTTASLLAVFAVDILTLVYVAMLHDPALLAAVGVAKTLVFLNSGVMSGLVISAGAQWSGRIGRLERGVKGRWAGHLVWLTLALSGGLGMLELVLAGPATAWFGADPALWQAGKAFAVWAVPAAALSCVMQLCAQLLRAEGYHRTALMVVLSGALSLAVLDPLFIFGLGMGLPGAGLACALSAALAAVTGTTLVARHIGLRWACRPALFVSHARQVLKLAGPAMLGTLAMPCAVTYLMLTISGFGAPALAAMAVIDRLLQLGYGFYFALPSALTPVLAQNLGAGLGARAQQATRFTQRLVVLYGLAAWTLFTVGAIPLARLFELPADAHPLFLLFCHAGAGLWIIFGLDFIAAASFLALGRPWWVAGFAWLRASLGTWPFVYFGAHTWGAGGALLGMWVGNALVAALAVVTASIQVRAVATRNISVPIYP